MLDPPALLPEPVLAHDRVQGRANPLLLGVETHLGEESDAPSAPQMPPFLSLDVLAP